MVALGASAGYRYAQSGALKVDSQRNTEKGVGSTVENGGKKVIVDGSSMLISTQLTVAL
jgi:hypothetical protein